jgi:hypothetical protein
MIAAMTTLLFLTILWLLGVLAVRTAAESGPRISAAIDGLPGGYADAARRRLAAS